MVYIDAGGQPAPATIVVDQITKSATGKTLKVFASVVPACDGSGQTTPYALVRIHKQPGATLSRFTIDTDAPPCPPPPPPVLQPGQCDQDQRCPGVGQCIPRTWDSCTPNRPGCVGVCACMPSSTACPPGEQFDASVDVCGCAPR